MNLIKKILLGLYGNKDASWGRLLVKSSAEKKVFLESNMTSGDFRDGHVAFLSVKSDLLLTSLNISGFSGIGAGDKYCK